MVKGNGKRITNLIAINMKVITQWIKSMVTVSFNGKVETFTRETMKMTKDMVMVKCFGSTALFTEANGKREYKMVKAF